MTTSNDILLINRDKYFLAQSARALKDEGFTVHTALEMRTALSTLCSHPVGLIICDKDLQDIGGCEFLSFIKKDPLRENIPFMFYVSLNDQGRPSQAFKLGAVDYIVYPIDTQSLVTRINEAFSHGSPEPPVLPSKSVQPQKSAPTGDEKTSDLNPKIVKSFNVQVSRDGILWMPSKIISLSGHSLSIETALMGKAGVELMIRFKKSEGTFILTGRIKNISFNDFQRPAGLEIEVEEDDNWRRLQSVLEQASNVPESAPSNKATAETARNSTVNQSDAPLPAENDLIDADSFEFRSKSEKESASYDKRFYHSLIGKQLDNYRAITLIGIGNMGGVLHGWDVALEREVALKIISYKLASKETFRELFIKEARVISKLNHPNISHIYSIGNSDEILYYAMEFIDGITLKELITNERQLSPQKGIAYLQTVCEALEVVYQNSIVHRDIKPSNIMINTKGVLKIVDFGVAKTHDARTGKAGKKAILGTPLYMSPEQIVGLAIDHRSDMYSLGATFYHALSGAPPFRADNVKELLKKHLNEPLVPLSDKNKKISSDLSRVIERMMAKDPYQRYNDFQEIIEELEPLKTE